MPVSVHPIFDGTRTKTKNRFLSSLKVWQYFDAWFGLSEYLPNKVACNLISLLQILIKSYFWQNGDLSERSGFFSEGLRAMLHPELQQHLQHFCLPEAQEERLVGRIGKVLQGARLAASIMDQDLCWSLPSQTRVLHEQSSRPARSTRQSVHWCQEVPVD